MRSHTLTRVRTLAALLLAASLPCFAGQPAGETAPDAQRLEQVLSITGTQVNAFLDQFSDVKCIEQVEQEKFGKDDKVAVHERATYDYLVMLSNNGGEINLSESRQAVHEDKDKKNRSLLISNGFATLFLVFHPVYAGSFQYRWLGEDTVDGRQLTKIGFEHIRGTRSPAALALRGREYPLELSGSAWIDAETGNIARIEAGIGDTLQDVGLKTISSRVEFAPVPFGNLTPVYWFPTTARVEVETPRQHWRNTHHFTDYKKFSVSTEDKVIQKP